MLYSMCARGGFLTAWRGVRIPQPGKAKVLSKSLSGELGVCPECVRPRTRTSWLTGGPRKGNSLCQDAPHLPTSPRPHIHTWRNAGTRWTWGSLLKEIAPCHTRSKGQAKRGGKVATQRFGVESGCAQSFVWHSGRWGNKIIHAEPSSWGRVSTQEDEHREMGRKKKHTPELTSWLCHALLICRWATNSIRCT